MKRLSEIAICLLLTASAAAAAPFNVSDGWFRLLPGNLPAGGYFTAENNTGHAVAITGARSEACGLLMLHQSRAAGGMSSMDMVGQVPLPPGGRVSFAPGGYHLMCEQPRMKIGEKVGVSINLSDGSSVAVAFQVRGATGKP